MHYSRKLKAVVLVALAVAVGSVPALGQWRVSSGASISAGQGLVVLVAELDAGTTLYGQCAPAGGLSLYVSAADGGTLPPLVSTVEIGVGIDGGTASWARGTEERQGGTLVTRWTDAGSARAVIDALAGARSEVVLSIHRAAVATTDSWRVDARPVDAMGASDAALVFLERCRTLHEAAGRPAPAPSPLVAPSELFRQQPGAGGAPPAMRPPEGWSFEPGPQPRLVARTPDDLDLVLTCNTPGFGTVSFESGDRVNFPAGQTSEGSIAFGTEDDLLPLVLTPGDDRGGKATLVATDPQVFALISVALLLATDEPAIARIFLAVNAPGGASKVAHTDMAGSAGPTAQFNNACFG